jgi:hypothetical protein
MKCFSTYDCGKLIKAFFDDSGFFNIEIRIGASDIGGKLTHDCGTSRAIGWFIEVLLSNQHCAFTYNPSCSGIQFLPL